MDQILEECQGCIRITDDITIHGHTEVKHDTCLWNLMEISGKYDLVFNPQKTHVKAQAVNFFGCLYNANCVHPDLGKVDTIHALLVPTNVTELRKFLGLVIYLSPFIPGLSTLTAPLWKLLKGHRLHLELHLQCHFSLCKRSCHQQHHPQLFWPLASHDDTSQHLTGRPWCSTPAKQQTHGFCQEGPYQNWMPVCQHRERC